VYTASRAFVGLADSDAGRLIPRRLIATRQT
jgi:hypothetical protein